MNQSKLNTFFSTLNIILCIVGYQLATAIFSPFMPEAEASRIVTVPFRAFALLICLITIFLNFKSKFRLNLVIKVLLVYWLFLLIRFFYDLYIRTDVFVSDDKRLQTILFMIPMTIIPMYSVMKSYRFIDLKKLLSWTYTLFFISVAITYINNVSFQEASLERLGGNTALNTITTGHLGLSTFILSIYYLTNKHLDILKNILVTIIGILGLILMLRSGSRGPILALMGVVAVWILGASKKKVLNISLLLIVSFIGYFFIDYIMQAISFISPFLYDRLTYSASAGQIEGRDSFYIYAINSFLESPIWGKNFAIYWGDGTMIYVHNVFLDSLMQLGIIGGGLIIYILYKPIVKTIKIINIRSPYFWIGLILMQNIMMLMVSGAIYYEPIVSILIVLLFMPLDRDNYSLQKHNQ